MPTVTAAARPVLFAATGAVAFILVRLVPAARVYDLCVGTARLLARPLNWLARCLALGVLKDIGVTILQHMLCVATRHGGVAVRVRVDDDGLLEAVFRRHGRVLLCTAHLGLTMAIQRALHERAIPLYLMGRPVRADGLHWGCPKAAPIIPSDALCLIRARRVLRNSRTSAARSFLSM